MATDPELLDAIMAAACGFRPGAAKPLADHWPAFLALLGDSIQAEGMALTLLAPEARLAAWHWGAAPALPAAADITRLRVDRVYSQIDLPGAAHEAQPLRALRCPVPGLGHMLLQASRMGADFRAIDAARLSNLGRRIACALAGWHALEAERARARLGSEGARRMGLGWLVLSPLGQVLASAPQMDAGLLRRAGLRLRADGRLDIQNSDLADAILAAQSGAHPRVIGAATAEDSAICVAPLPPSAPTGPGVILWIRGAEPLRDLPPPLLARAFGISPSEARLAARIADGQSLAEAAQDLGWTIETARSCSKALYAHLGARGQTGVALALQIAPLAIAHAD